MGTFDNFFAYSLRSGVSTGTGTGSDTSTGTGVGVSSNLNLVTSGLIAYWNFDEESGDRVDATGGGLDFVDVNLNTGSTNGVVNKALNFTQTQNIIAAKNPDDSRWRLFDGDFTLSLWFNWTKTSFGRILVKTVNASTTDTDYQFIILSDSNQFLIGLTFDTGYSSTYRFNYSYSGSTEYLTFTHNLVNKTISFYVNAANSQTISYTGNIISNSDRQVILGGKKVVADSSDFIGWMDEMSLYDRVLTTTEIAQNYSSYNAN